MFIKLLLNAMEKVILAKRVKLLKKDKHSTKEIIRKNHARVCYNTDNLEVIDMTAVSQNKTADESKKP